MACSVSGVPSYRVCLNTAGNFYVADNSGGSETTRFRVGVQGVVEVTAEIKRSGTLVLYDDSAEVATILELHSGSGTAVKHFSFDWTSGSTARIKGIDDTSDAPLLLEGAPVRINNPTAGSVDILSLRSSSSERAKVAWAGTSSETRFEAPDHVTVHFGARGSVRSLNFKATIGGTGTILTTLDSQYAVWTFKDNAGVGQAKLEPKATVGSDVDTVLTLGLAEETRGKLVLDRESSSGAERAGVLVFTTLNGSQYYVWVGNNGKLLISPTDPTTTDTGTVVGSQVT